mgnify:CR=1 FL=1
MKKYITILPRQSGKTKMGIYEFLKDPDNTIYIVYNNQAKDFIIERIGFLSKNIITHNNIKNKLRSKRIKKLIFDEYMFFDNKEEIYNIVNTLNIEELYIFSSSNKLYSNDIFEYLKENKFKYNLNHLVENYKYKSEHTRDEIYELYYNFITDSDAIMININHNINKNIHYIISNEQYELEVLNKYLH